MDAPDHAAVTRSRDDRRVAELVAMLRRAHPNVLVVGRTTTTNRALELMFPHLLTPIVSWEPREAPDLSTIFFRTLVIRDVDGLDPTQQGRLGARIGGPAGEIQIISTAAAPFLPLVKRGAFLDCLYYQLNTVCFDLSDDRDS